MEATAALPTTATAISRPTSFQLDEFYDDLLENGSIRLLSNKKVRERPFPGLRPFKASEFQLFRGRDGQAEALVNRLKRNHFLAVIGSSGTGKSSLVRAGLIPHLLGGYFPEAGKQWDIAICRPGHDPLENLSIALARIKSRSNDNEKILLAYDEVAPEINDNIYGILEVNEQLHSATKESGEKKNLLIIVDQFEELFRFNRDDLNNPGIEAHFVNLLLKASAAASTSVYVIITMRSEFLGDSVKYRGLPEAINEGQYLVPQLSRTELRDVIEGPIRLAGKKIEPGLVEMLINEIEQSKLKKNLDQLPILQHTLMRTFEQASLNETSNEITEADYEACGGMEKALANHAEAKYRALAQKENRESFDQKIAKLVFQALTDSSTNQKGGRRPTELEIIHAIAKSLPASPEEVNRVIDTFRDTETSFIMPPINTPLFPQLIIDISHESLMRQWQRLRDWADEEAQSAQVLTRLMQAQRFYKQGQKDLLKGKELYPIAHWFKTSNPQPMWAKRYEPDYEEGFVYLKKSEGASNIRTVLNWLGTVAGIGIIFFFFYYNSEQKQKQIQKRSFAVRSQEAASDGDALLAALYFAKAYSFGKDQNMLREANAFLPVYFLKSIVLNKSDTSLSQAAFTETADRLLVWNDHDILFTWDLKKDSLISSPEHYRRPGEDPLQNLTTGNFGLDRLFAAWRLDSNGRGVILNPAELRYVVEVPKTIGSLDFGKLNKDSSLFLTFGTYSFTNDSTYSAVLRNLGTGKQIGTPFLHTGQIDAVAISDDNSKIAILENSGFFIRIFEKVDFDKRKVDEDLPASLYALQMEVATGVKVDEKGSLQVIPTDEWKQLRNKWLREAERHYENCKHQEANYWGHCIHKKNKDRFNR